MNRRCRTLLIALLVFSLAAGACGGSAAKDADSSRGRRANVKSEADF